MFFISCVLNCERCALCCTHLRPCRRAQREHLRLPLGVYPFVQSDSAPSHEKKLVIFLTSDSAIAPEASSELKREVGDLLRPAAIRVEWQDPAVDRGGSEDDYSAVVHLKGSCRPAEPSTRFEHAISGPFTLASSAVSDGVILPFGDIDCAALNSFLGPVVVARTGSGAPTDLCARRGPVDGARTLSRGRTDASPRAKRRCRAGVYCRRTAVGSFRIHRKHAGRTSCVSRRCGIFRLGRSRRRFG